MPNKGASKYVRQKTDRTAKIKMKRLHAETLTPPLSEMDRSGSQKIKGIV